MDLYENSKFFKFWLVLLIKEFQMTWFLMAPLKDKFAPYTIWK